jgi:hypothetical protein
LTVSAIGSGVAVGGAGVEVGGIGVGVENTSATPEQAVRDRNTAIIISCFRVDIAPIIPYGHDIPEASNIFTEQA